MRAGRTIERLAWIAGIVMLGGYAVARLSFEEARTAGIDAFETREAALGPTAAVVTPVAADTLAHVVDAALWSEQRVRAFHASAGQSPPPLGVLRIAAIGLEVPVYPGTTEANLNRGAAHIAGTSLVAGHGNFGLASHRDGWFRKLGDLAIDDALELETAGRKLVFDVVELAIVAPDETGVLAPTGRPSVTLVTCYPFYFVGHAPQRFIVRAELRASAAAALPDTVNPFASRRGKSHED